MLNLAVMSMFGFTGTRRSWPSPRCGWCGGGAPRRSGPVNGLLLAATVPSQLAVPRALATWGTGGVLVTGLLLLGVPAPAYLLSDELRMGSRSLSCARGGLRHPDRGRRPVVAQLVPASRRGAAIGVYGLSVAVPNLLLLPGSVPVVDRWGFAPVFWMRGRCRCSGCRPSSG